MISYFLLLLLGMNWHHQVAALIRRDFLFEWRNLYQIGAILGFMLGVSYIFYFYSGEISARSWSLAYWVSLLFLSFFSGGKIFESDLGECRFYSFQLINPFIHFISKSIFVIIELYIYSIMLWLVFWFLLPFKIQFGIQWLALLFICISTIGLIISFASYISMSATGKQILISILSLPIVFPILGMGFVIGMQLIEPNINFNFIKSIYPLLGIQFFCMALLIFIVPLIWKS